MDDITLMRYRPALGGIVDTAEGRVIPRDYTALEIVDAVRWLNERQLGYPSMVVAARTQS